MSVAKFNPIAAVIVVLASLAPFLQAQKRTAPRKPALELVMLGSGGPRSFGRASTSYLVLVEGIPRILVDAGPGAFQTVGKLGLGLDRMDIILLTHLHIDHSGDLPAMFLNRTLMSDGPIRFRVFGPQ